MKTGDRVSVRVRDRWRAGRLDFEDRAGSYRVTLDAPIEVKIDPLDAGSVIQVERVYRGLDDIRPLAERYLDAGVLNPSAETLRAWDREFGPWEDEAPSVEEQFRIRDEARAAGKSTSAAHRKWGALYRQFDLVRVGSGARYLTRWYLVSTPFGGVALHRMEGPDARTVVHDHPWPFVSFVLRGGYVEDRLNPKTMRIEEREVRRVNVVGHRAAHTIKRLLRVPTWTLVFVGPYGSTWGFWQPVDRFEFEQSDEERAHDESLGLVGTGFTNAGGLMRRVVDHWKWTKHDAFDSGHYVP